LPSEPFPVIVRGVEMFELIGETLRRLRKERGSTLEDLRRAARLGRGQLSRIENGKQEATFSTLAKILNCQEVSRREFFRRYELVESEALALERQEPGQDAAGEDWPQEIQEVLAKVDSFVRFTFDQPRPVAQGAVEIGDLVVLFRVVPKAAGAPSATPARPGEEAGGGAPKLRGLKPRTGRGRKRKR
jgi:transcriptional regulator with XRE-family HTH domain